MKKLVAGVFPVCILILFSFLFLFIACNQQPPFSKEVVVFWKDGKATGLIIPKLLLAGISEDSIPTTVIIRRAGQTSPTGIAGDYSIHENEIRFEPLIPFTRGLRYEVLVKDTLFHAFLIPEVEDAPRLIAIYPTQDTLPENFLKIYLVFSRPMAVTPSLQHIVLTNEKGDTLPEVFLDLPNELWNEERTAMTLWMNPGRVKRDLQPNQQLGAPLERGQQYKLIVSGEWKDANGKALKVASQKDFVVVGRDAVSPSPENWKLQLPKAGTTEALLVELDESLDYYLLKNTVRVVDSSGKDVIGSMMIGEEESLFSFKPEMPWVSGLYKLKIEARLEDLSGNNLNRPFDRDLLNKQAPVNGQVIYEKTWTIR